MIKKILTLSFFCFLFLMILSLKCLSQNEFTLNIGKSKKPLSVVDASTGKLISEILVIPRYFSFQGISTMLGEGPQQGSDTYYLDKPFIYHAGETFKIKSPKSAGLNAGILFIGKGRSLQGFFLVAAKYRPLWIRNSNLTENINKIQLTPISDGEWDLLLETRFSPFIKDSRFVSNSCGIWELPEKCTMEIYYNKEERKLIHSFLQPQTSNDK